VTGRHRHDDGVATVAGIALIAVLILVGVATAVVGGAVLAHRRAQAAADLAALAAAQALQGQGGPCRQAARIAHANGAELRACTIDGWIASVEVVVSGPRLIGRGLSLPARSRAGPSPSGR
jgi:secretion/DNA translocation related TadE-like protein